MEINVNWHQDALDAIDETYLYVKQFSPKNAKKVADLLMEFGNSLGLFPEKYKICTQRSLMKHKFHCVSFENHLFVYDIEDGKVEILKIFHARMNPKKFKV